VPGKSSNSQGNPDKKEGETAILDLGARRGPRDRIGATMKGLVVIDFINDGL
jgi:hypothetical protein